jgi:hypothetical protein
MKNDSLLNAAKTILTSPLVEGTVELQEASLGSSYGNPFKGSEEDIIFLDDLDGFIKQLRNDVVNKRMTYQTAHLAHTDDMPTPTPGPTKWYVFDKPQKFTAPALVAIKG